MLRPPLWRGLAAAIVALAAGLACSQAPLPTYTPPPPSPAPPLPCRLCLPPLKMHAETGPDGVAMCMATWYGLGMVVQNAIKPAPNSPFAPLPVGEEQREEDGVAIEEAIGEPPITVPFNPEQIKIHTVNIVASQIVTRIREGEIDLAPDFQRAFIWKPDRQSRLIESLMLRIPIPVFYVAADNNDNWRVVDGVQRISTINNYIGNTFALKGLEYLQVMEGMMHKDLPRPMQRRIDETQLVVNVIDPRTPEEVMFNVFSRINTGGEPLTAQEIRHALTPGIARTYLKRLASTNEFLRATAWSVNPSRMKDRECVLRFLAFYMEPWDSYGTGDLNGYLTSAMRKINEASEKERAEWCIGFTRAMNAASVIFGNDAFRRRSISGRRSPVNMALLETWGVALANCSVTETEKLMREGDTLKSSFESLMEADQEFINAISFSTDNQKHVEKRFTAVEDMVRSML